MEESPTTPDSPQDSERRVSFGGKVVAGLSGGIGRLANLAGAATTLITDGDLRKRGVSIVTQGISHGIQTGASSIKSGIQSGISTVQQGPRQIQSVLQRLAQQIEEQRMHILLEQQKDAPVDIQVGFQVYEDAPQELRSRLWMALLQHPELLEQYNLCARTLAAEQHQEQEEEEQGADASEEGNKQETIPQEEACITPIATANTPENTANDAAIPHHGDNNNDEPPESVLPPSTSQEKAEGWDIVLESQPRQGSKLLRGASSHRAGPWNVTCEAFRNELMAVMTAVPYPLPTEYSEEDRYGTLLQISIGQEDMDEIIARDIHRTFPEYPLFAFEQGQLALFRVLKAYSLNDLEVGYCQGMAFVAGLILFYVPEEPAFQILCRLFSEKGPNLRRLYLPGLEGLKTELKKFEWLMEKHLPTLKAHLEAHGAVPVLFASQWFLTAFSCPFPVSFACRLIDVVLLENNDSILLKTAVTIMAECEAELLMQEDFEELLTYLKVEPMNWPHHRLQRILDAAYNSPITAKDLEDAAAAALENHSLSAPRLVSEDQAQQHDDNERGRLEEDVGSLDESEVQVLNTNANQEKDAEGATKTDGGLRDEDEQQHQVPRDAVEAELAKHRADLDDQYLAMVLDVENNWAGAGDVGGFEDALMAASSAKSSPDKNKGKKDVVVEK